MIRSEADIAEALDELLRLDPRLAAIAATAGPLPLRRLPAGLRGLLRTLMGQQVSIASADAIFARFASLVDLDDPHAILAAPEETFRAAGLSRAKQQTALAVAEAIRDGRLDLARVEAGPSPAGIAELVAVRGIGRWTAECHLLFAAGHRDVFPAGDLALQVAVSHALSLEGRISERALATMAALWSPVRSAAARLFWAHYRTVTRRSAVPGAVPAGSGGAEG
ncbi:DNA-3-methyladenine glycosylase family protein [Aureimonas pseudogalii]|uniref:DNA-3-methyladenine glycosylase II n=1 Tax=Aureimonas pseudogalii TaxID=1744844 RepID=A0A7W6E7T7_9HYPH|nr:DNA-3-methyladenine glycosylase 2 family protein [Aureimonas pseudogalii]MBB3996293.1 DNA-3-methyladenine glycosylase II [Aureimonas pseudogalii]